ncbi:hypothetical protein RBI22_15175 [Alcaligenaceae bacterium C4P045]|nr:hypothetical protein [Alcaligenaceae bacterium C4P045]
MRVLKMFRFWIPGLVSLSVGGGGGGGDGGAAKMEADRQARVDAAVAKINAIFNGQDQSVVTGQATAFDPNATYYNADGSQYMAPTKSVQTQVAQQDPAAGYWTGGGDNGETWVANPGITAGSSGGDNDSFGGYYRNDTVTDMNAVKKALSGGELYTGVDTIKGIDRQGMYDQQRQAVTDVNTRDVNRQAEEATRANKFGLARSGLAGGSVDIDSNADLTRRQNEGLIKAAGIGDQAAADLRTSDERTRQNLISMAQSGIDTGQAGQLALSGLEANSQNAASAASGAQIGSLFGDLSNAYLVNQQLAGQRAGFSQYPQQRLGNSVRSGGSAGTLN